MSAKCRTGQKKVGAMCVSKKIYKRFGKFSDEFIIMKLAVIGAITSVGGWAIFKGIVDLTGMDQLSGIWMIVIGLSIITLTYKFGFGKLK